ncbi:hypothetical protein [Actinomadura welshii]|uniref:hypothetical protein n=1 Tax=Actinomadura welshii TaxID=3103817 RepID=UPI0003AD54D9|nr:hypothetical protein [Actinomadura madurae]
MVIALFDQAVSARESRAKAKTDEELVERAKKGEARQLLMTEIPPVLTDPAIPDEEVGGCCAPRSGCIGCGRSPPGEGSRYRRTTGGWPR